MGKLYESRNGAHALRYYEQAVMRFAPDEPELAELLKDRGWLHFYRKEWADAETDLERALMCAPPTASRLQADILDAMASLNREVGERTRALAYAERALAIRETVGDLLAIAKSLGNLGFLYRTMHDYRHALLAHQEALATYQKLGNRELAAAAWLNIGAAHFHAGDLAAATEAYRQSLEIGQSLQLPLIELKAHYNLAEALAATRQRDEALHHWRAGYQLCAAHGYADHAADFRELAGEIGLPIPSGDGDRMGEGDSLFPLHPSALEFVEWPDLSPDERAIVELLRREPNITARRLMTVVDVSRATATRRLVALVEKGVLAAHGQGRGAHYTLAAQSPRPQPSAPVPDTDTDTDADDQSVSSHLRAALLEQRVTLASDYGVEGVGLSSASGEAARIVVSFIHLPDLAHFFVLRQYLATHLGCEVELLPDFALTPAQQGDVEWLWQP
jgi:Tfp pilus assembly protein PilF